MATPWDFAQLPALVKLLYARAMNFVSHVYILRCSDGSYYVGKTQGNLEFRVAQHNSGTCGGYTFARRPVTLVWSQEFASVTDAIAAERQVKGWRREKKEALIAGEFAKLPGLSRRGARPSPNPSSSS